jgi:hypothetical protein
MEFTLNGKRYEVLKFLGKGKGGYSYLVTDGAGRYTLKKIHHEPCDYYTFGDKLGSELRDYERLRAVGIPMPELLDVDREQELLLKEYIDGPSIYELVKEDQMVPDYYHQVRAMCAVLYPAGLNIDYFPTNFIVQEGSSSTSIMSATVTWSGGILTTGGMITGGRVRRFWSMWGVMSEFVQGTTARVAPTRLCVSV